ncbi:ribonuclease T(2) [Pseudomonas sp. M47T1]|uniref:ribonuclease T2 family protein n=1 Tax=Pseudomonas sp. M47T1 TaxID=1179778 RepID=UPI0002606F48|nr:ribonuclease T2 [Pseudomonas sp. M47T1]EIK95705.1 ribonuclease T(2) [Pseudomonas sp. M47T1]
MTRIVLITLVLLCSLGTADARQKGTRPEAVAGQFDYYLLSLSWSPTFCLTHGNNEQCSGKGYGFVLHGLWPQYAKGGWPQSCAPITPLSPAERSQGAGLYPSRQLLDHEWTKHGTCSGLSATDYLSTADKAVGRVKVPGALQPSENAQSFAPRQIVQLLRQSNPGMPEDGVVVRCSGAQLAEVRVCLSKDLAFTSCGRGVKMQCSQDSVRVPGIR